jgi:hypothetical protein
VNKHGIEKNIRQKREGSSVARWGEFLPLGQHFIFGRFLRTTEVAQHFGASFSTVPVMFVIIFDKAALGFVLGDFFTNTSGHPGMKGRGQGCQIFSTTSDQNGQSIPIDAKMYQMDIKCARMTAK